MNPSETKAPEPESSSPAFERCPNCDEALTGPFCSACGQKNTHPRLEAGQLMREAFAQWLNLESALVRTIRGLTRNPGALCRDYVAGRRKRYTHPFKYCLTLVALFFLVNTMLGLEIGLRVEGPTDPDAAAKTEILRDFVATHITNILFLALPFFALGLRLVFRSAGFNVAEIYAFVLFVTGHVFLFGLLLLSLSPWVSGPWLVLLRFTVHMLFFAWAAVVFFEAQGPWGVLKAMACHVLYMFCIMGVALVLAVAKLLVMGGFEG